MCKYRIIAFYGQSRATQKSPSTARQNVEKLERVMDMLCDGYGVTVEDHGITGLNGEVLQEWYNNFANGRKMTTLNNYVCTINPFLRWAKTMNYLNDDLSGVLTTGKILGNEYLPEWQRPKEKYLTHDEADELVNTSQGRNLLRDRAFISLILYTGIRCEEGCSLNLSDILDRPRGTIHLKRKGGRWQTIPINAEVYVYLDAYLETRDLSDHSQPLFMTTHGNRCSPKQMYKALSFKQKRVGENGVATGAHALRHTFISEVEKRAGAGIARDLAGQRSLIVTNRYIHTTEDQLRDAVDGLKWKK